MIHVLSELPSFPVLLSTSNLPIQYRSIACYINVKYCCSVDSEAVRYDDGLWKELCCSIFPCRSVEGAVRRQFHMPHSACLGERKFTWRSMYMCALPSVQDSVHRIWKHAGLWGVLQGHPIWATLSTHVPSSAVHWLNRYQHDWHLGKPSATSTPAQRLEDPCTLG